MRYFVIWAIFVFGVLAGAIYVSESITAPQSPTATTNTIYIVMEQVPDCDALIQMLDEVNNEN